jgi:hypothetical protein
MMAGYWPPQASANSSNRACAACSVGAVYTGRSCLDRASQSRREAYRTVFRIKWMMHAWTVVSGQVVVIASGRPLSPSQTVMHTSSTPRFLISVSTDSQNFALSWRTCPWVNMRGAQSSSFAPGW